MTVKDWIIEGQLQPNEKISDVEISEYFHVSRTPVREALQLLETQKLIKTYPGRATIVTEMETDDINKWYLPMATLQELAVSIAVPKRKTEDIITLNRLNEHFLECLRNKNDTMNLLRADMEFHEKILKMSENEYIVDFCNVLWIHIQRLEYKYFLNMVNELSADEHKKIIQAIERKDTLAASVLVKDHWRRSAICVQQLYSK